MSTHVDWFPWLWGVDQWDVISPQQLNIAPTQSTISQVTILLDLKRPTYLYKNFVQFNHRNGLSQTFEAPVAEDELVVPFHFLQLGLGGFEPALGSENAGVWAKNDSAAVDRPTGVATRGGQPGKVSRKDDIELYPMSVPPGRNTPFNVSPSGGTLLQNSPVVGGNNLKPFLIQACRYGKALASESLIGLEMVPLIIPSSISALRRQRALGVVVKKRMVALMVFVDGISIMSKILLYFPASVLSRDWLWSSVSRVLFFELVREKLGAGWLCCGVPVHVWLAPWLMVCCALFYCSCGMLGRPNLNRSKALLTPWTSLVVRRDFLFVGGLYRICRGQVLGAHGEKIARAEDLRRKEKALKLP